MDAFKNLLLLACGSFAVATLLLWIPVTWWLRNAPVRED